MTALLKPIEALEPAAGIDTLLYTAPADNTVVLNLIINNLGVATATYSIYKVPSGDSPDAGNVNVNEQPILTLERHCWEEKQFMNEGDELWIVSDIVDVLFSGNVVEQ